MRKTVLTLLSLAILVIATTAFGSIIKDQNNVSSIQEAINKALPGEIVHIPPGVYNESITLKEEITLIGAGAGQTVINGQGDEVVVRGASGAIIAGFTITGGKIGIENGGNFMGIFNNIVCDNTHIGIHIVGGSSIVMNNILIRNSGLGAIACNSSNPVISNNTIAGNDCAAIWSWYPLGPNARDNIIANNQIGFHIGAGSEPIVEGNLLYNLNQPAIGIELPDSNLYQDPLFVDYNSFDLRLNPESPAISKDITTTRFQAKGVDFYASLKVGELRQLMNEMLQEVVSESPVVEYNLTTEPGLFYVTTKFSVMQFATRSSTKDTEVREYVAYDSFTDISLPAELKYEEYPTIIVKGGEVFDRSDVDRYVLESLFYHPGSYYLDESSRLIFNRGTNFSRIVVIVPAGYAVTDINFPAKISPQEDGRVRVELARYGWTDLHIVMEEINPLTINYLEAR